ncbi:hypothetical protein, partial [Acidithiobacillus thiooxidans]
MFLKQATDLRNSTQGAFQSVGMSSRVVDKDQMTLALRVLLNPQVPMAVIEENTLSDLPFGVGLLEKDTRMAVLRNGGIAFGSKVLPDLDAATEVLTAETDPMVAMSLTVDALPSLLSLNNTAQMLGDPASREDRIAPPFWIYTTIHVLDSDKASEALTMKLGSLNKQAMSDSPWYRSMMSHLFRRRDDATYLLEQLHNGKSLVRAYSGLTIYTPLSRTKR